MARKLYIVWSPYRNQQTTLTSKTFADYAVTLVDSEMPNGDTDNLLMVTAL